MISKSKLLAVAFLAMCLPGFAQSTASDGAQPDRCTDLEGNVLPCPPTPEVKTDSKSDSVNHRPAFVKDFVSDQRSFWLAPARIRERDLKWIIPLASATTVVIASDTAIAGRMPKSASVINRSRDFSNAGVAALAATGAGLYFSGWIAGNERRRETGWMAGEALVNSLLVSNAVKFAAGRQRPLEGNGRGDFRSGGQSFVSDHSAAAWSVATVVANRYPSPFAKMLAYGTAAGVSATRLTGREHFASDVLIGGMIGWYMGRQVLRSHAGESEKYGTFVRAADESSRTPANMGSPYVPIDSWVYASFDRLSAWGYVQSGFLGLRPWTRLECVRLLQEAGESLQGDESSEPAQVLTALRSEFSREMGLLEGGSNASAEISSVYTRVTQISGPPLRDGFHFGQSIINDYGRPYARGFNNITGLSAQATAGPIAFYIRGEYQHAPGAPALPEAARDAIANDYWHEVKPSTAPSPGVDRVRLLDAYAAVNVDNWQLSFGRQTLWWGPGSSGPLLFSNNAEPVLMARLSRTSPSKLPWIFGLLGPMRTEYFVGRLSGQHFINAGGGVRIGTWSSSLANQPFLHGEKVSFKPTPNLEFGVSRTGMFGGPGHPVTLSSFGHAVFSTSTSNKANDPGDRRSGFDFSYRVPKLRKWLVLYNDSLTEDEMSPIAYPRRSAMSPGIYLPQLPKIPKLDFRAEAVYTDLPGLVHQGYFYYNLKYISGYTNDGSLIGNWVGRQGRGLQLRSRYWFAPQKTVTMEYREQKVSEQFLEGGRLRDVAGTVNWLIRPGVMLTGSIQYQRWDFPVLVQGTQSNLVSSIQFTYRPRN